jgi:preprotein translocase SecE subunit
MSDVDDKQRVKSEDKLLAESEPATIVEGPGGDLSTGDDGDGAAATQLGATKYVQTAFFAAGIAVAYLSSKALNALWNSLAEWPAAVRYVPQLLRFAEDERPSYTLVAGAIIGIVVTIIYYRKESIRGWAYEVASELSKVTWPKREAVTNGSIVVLAAGAFATVYVGLLDRLWSFVTMLVYGA